jgi:hypothetical protein
MLRIFFEGQILPPFFKKFLQVEGNDSCVRHVMTCLHDGWTSAIRVIPDNRKAIEYNWKKDPSGKKREVPVILCSYLLRPGFRCRNSRGSLVPFDYRFG